MVELSPAPAQAMQRPMRAIERRIDARVWSSVARDSSADAREVALAMLAAGSVGARTAAAGAAAGLDAVAGVRAVGGVPAMELPAAAQPPAAVAGVAGSPVALEVVALVNEARAAHGLAPVTVDIALARVAGAHSRQMASAGRMAHDGIGNGTPSERIRAALPKARRTAENVAAGQPDAAAVMRGWMDSPGHRANILDPQLRRIGVDVAPGTDGRPYWTQVFAG